jgi:hypothetical protein
LAGELQANHPNSIAQYAAPTIPTFDCTLSF